MVLATATVSVFARRNRPEYGLPDARQIGRATGCSAKLNLPDIKTCGADSGSTQQRNPQVRGGVLGGRSCAACGRVFLCGLGTYAWLTADNRRTANALAASAQVLPMSQLLQLLFFFFGSPCLRKPPRPRSCWMEFASAIARWSIRRPEPGTQALAAGRPYAGGGSDVRASGSKRICSCFKRVSSPNIQAVPIVGFTESHSEDPCPVWAAFRRGSGPIWSSPVPRLKLRLSAPSSGESGRYMRVRVGIPAGSSARRYVYRPLYASPAADEEGVMQRDPPSTFRADHTTRLSITKLRAVVRH